MPINILLGIGGSHAHGLSHEGSDVDYRGVHSYATDSWWSLTKPQQTIVHSAPDPDKTSHELEKFLSLSMKGNPDVLETFGLDTYVDMEPKWGPKLIALQEFLFSNEAIKTAYMGYAKQQFAELKKRHAEGNDSFSAGTGTRTWKQAKHMFRLMETGQALLRTGVLHTKVKDRAWYLEKLPQLNIDELISIFEKQYEETRALPGVLPDEPDYDAVDKFIYDYRKAH